MNQLVTTLGLDVAQFAFWAAVAFMVGYTLLAKWWRSEVGWARISLDFGIAIALAPTLVHVWFGTRVENNLGFAWYAIGSIAFVGCVCLWNLLIVGRTQLRGHWRRIREDGYDRRPPDRDAGPTG